MLDGRVRKNIRAGTAVAVVLKADQPTGALTWGRVAEILTNSSTHPHGIKVRLTSGQVGRVQQIYNDE
ncbi:YwbE family protein [Methanorbis rubei]|uniref:YwbE family protein n=1 Tax=Methanorbis rubei TaxID=3028300 RepID=UPI003B849A10